MARNVFYRDFTLCKAALLAGLIGMALLSGGVPATQPTLAEIKGFETPHPTPLVLVLWKAQCDTARWSGVDL